MIAGRPQHPLVTISVRVYGMLLAAYPLRFRQEYGSHMLLVFSDCCLRAIRQGGTNGMLRLWVVTLLDLIQSVVSEHRQKETQVKKEMKPEDIRLAGLALMIGTVAFAGSLVLGYVGDAIHTDIWMLPSVLIPFICMPLFLVGMLAIGSRYGEKVGGLAKNGLLVGGVVGTVTSIVGLFAAGVGELWLLIYTGPALLFAGLALFGIVALYKKLLPRWNALPFLAAIWYPAFFFLQLPSFFNGNYNTGYDNIIFTLLIALQGVALFLLGYVLRSDLPEEVVAAA